MQGQNIFDLLKLRASYGKVGNDQIPTDSYTNTVALNLPYPFNGSNSSATNGAQLNQFKDQNITWETTVEYDLAVEFSALRARLTGEVNYYDKKVDNALIFKPLAHTIFDKDHLILNNAAVIQNKGLEVVLGWKDKLTENLSYSISGNVTFNKNNVTALNGGLPLSGGNIGAAQGFVTYTDVGHSVGSYYVLNKLGVFNSDAEVVAYEKAGKPIQPNAHAGDFKYEDVNNDGAIDGKDKKFFGSYQPVAYYGANVGVSYKRWDVNLGIYGNAGNKVYNGKKAVRIAGTDNVEKDIVYSRWTSANHNQSQPAANTGNQLASNYFVESGSFIRINNLTLGYTLPPSALQKIKLTSLRVYAVSQNLFTYKKYSGFTAELPGDVVNAGIELSAYPTTRTVALGLNIGF